MAQGHSIQGLPLRDTVIAQWPKQSALSVAGHFADPVLSCLPCFLRCVSPFRTCAPLQQGVSQAAADHHTATHGEQEDAGQREAVLAADVLQAVPRVAQQRASGHAQGA